MVAIHIFHNHKKIIGQISMAEAEVSEDICENVWNLWRNLWKPSQQFGNLKFSKCWVWWLDLTLLANFHGIATHVSLAKAILYCSVTQSCPTLCDLQGLQQARLPCASLSPKAYWNSSSIFPSIKLFPMSWLFESGGQSIGASASALVLPMNIQDWFPVGLTGLISLQSKGLSRVFSNTTVQKHQFFSTQLYL